MNSGFKLVGALGGMLMATSALAVTPLQTTVSSSPAASTTAGTQTATVTATSQTPNPVLTATSPSASINRSLSGVSVSQFDTSTGILVGARVNVNTPVSANTQVIVNSSTGNGNRTATVSSSQTGTVSILGMTFGTTPTAIAGTRSCSGGNCTSSINNSVGQVTGTISGSQTVSSGNLSNFVGTGNVTFARNVTGTVGITASVQASNSNNGNGGNGNGNNNTVNTLSGYGNATYTFGGATAATYSITYDWLNFANPSLNGANGNDVTLDFTTLTQNSGPVTLNFTITNIGNANSADLKLVSFAPQLNNSNFTTNLATFNTLAGGNSFQYSVTFNPILLGAASEQFKLNFTDNVPGGIGMRNYTLNLFANANVVAAAIPEAKTWLMMIIGFGLVGVVRRRSGRRVVAA